MGRVWVIPCIAVTMLLIGCGHRAASPEQALRCIYEPRYAHGFSILQDTVSHATVLRITNPYQGADEYRTDFRFEHPFTRISTFSSSHVAMLDSLGCADHIVGISGARFILSPSVRERIDCGLIREIGYDSSVDLETIRTMGTEVALMYGVDGTNSRLEAKFDETGIRYLYIGDYVEEDPLGKAEWIVALAALCGRTDLGIERFLSIESRYMNVRNEASALSPKPGIMVNTPYRDVWYMPSPRSYMVRLIEDAGGRYLYHAPDGNGSTAISMEEAMMLVSECDIWINTGQAGTMEELRELCPRMAGMNVVTCGEAYNCDRMSGPEGGSGFWEGGAINPDLVLKDLHTIFSHGDESALTFYRRLR